MGIDVLTLGAAKSYVKQVLGDNGGQIKYEVVAWLPDTGENGTIYFTPNANSSYDEYMYIQNQWELLGSTGVNVESPFAIFSYETCNYESIFNAYNKNKIVFLTKITLPDNTVFEGLVGLKQKNSIGFIFEFYTTSLDSDNKKRTKEFQITIGSTNEKNITNQKMREYLDKTGDKMSGALELSAAPNQPMHAVTKQYVDDLIKNKIESSGVMNILAQEKGKGNLSQVQIIFWEDDD